MGEILKNWLLSQIGMKINFDAIYLGKTFQDGVLFKQILNNYGIISQSHMMPISHCSDFKMCQQNLRQLCVWFNLLNINFNETTISEIANGQCSTIIRLLYEMFLCFENKQYLYFITKQSQINARKSVLSRFELGNVLETTSIKDRPLSLERPLVENKDIIEWYKEKYSLLKEKLMCPTKEPLCSIEFNGITKANSTLQKTDSNLLPVFDFDDYSDEMNVKQGISNVVLPKDDYLLMLKLKKRKNAAKKSLAKKMQNVLLNSVWKNVHDSHGKEFDELFSKLIIKQSQYEKQIVTKLFQEHESNTFQKTPETLIEKEREHLCNLQLLDEYQRGKQMYDDEKQRILELHHKLYAEKQKVKAKENFKACAEAIDSVINIACRVYEYTSSNKTSVPSSQWNEWKQLFFKNVDVPALQRDSISVIDDGCDDESIGVISLVQDCDEILNEYYLHEYLYFAGTWFVEEIFPELGSPNEDEQIVLGYVVHRLLELKYPFPPSPKPAEIPPVVVAALVLDLQDSTAIQKLKMLLTKSLITVLEVDDLIKFSIDVFKTETNQAEPEKRKKGNKAQSKKSKESINKSSLSKEKSKNKDSKKTEKNSVNKKKESKKKENVKSPRSEKSQSEKEVSDEILENLETIFKNEKRTQTPAMLPEEDESPKRSEFGLLGEQIFNTLNSGLSVSDPLLVSTLIAYLKSQNSMNGWVLINFPNSILQASLVELALTGREIPNVNLAEHGYGQLSEVDETLNDLRFSKLVPYPSDLHVPEIFKSFFTKIICTKIKTAEKSDIVLEDISDNRSTKVEEDPVLNPEIFYKSQDVFYEFCCDELDLNNLKQLARYIMAEMDIDQKPSNELFGEDVLNTLSGQKKKGRKSVKSKRNSKKSLKKEKKKSEENTKSEREASDVLKSEMTEVTRFDEQMPDNCESVKPLEEYKEPASEKVTIEQLKPGEVGWNYAQFDIPNPVGVALANLWENMEQSYLKNLKQNFFNKRILLSRLIPYKNFVYKTIRALIEEPDIKQDLIAEFQEFHNSIDENLLQFTEMKNELHCKVFELQDNLWNICDKRKVSCANKLKEIINDGWATIEMCFLANIYLSFAQVELDRFVNTLILLNDYYTVMLGKLPINHKINYSISAIDLNSLKETLPASTDKKVLELCESNNIFDCIFNLLTNDTNGQDPINPFCIMLETHIDKAIENLENIGKNFENEIKKEENLLRPSKPKIKKEIKTKTKPNKKQKESLKLSILSTVATDETDILKKNLFDEWRYVLENEIKRAKYRCNLIKCKGVKDLSEFFNVISLSYHELFNDIKKRYYLAIETVDNVCKMISTAIEEEVHILETICIHDDELFVTRQSTLVEQHWPKELLEQTHNYIFSTEQARMLMEDLKRAAPCGFISKTPLVYIFEDILLKEKEGNLRRLPEIWNELKTKELEEIIYKMFGNVLLVDWRDLIVCCLNIPFPSVEELLILQKQCQNKDPDEKETLDYENFTDIIFWFERELADSPQDRLKLVNAKNLLYNLFKDEHNYVNYTALLLSFCKDIEPELGFSKALALTVQKRIILCESDLYLEQLSVGICSSEHDEKYQVVNKVMSAIVNTVLIQTESAIITEVEDGIISEESGEALKNSKDNFSAIIGDVKFPNLESFNNTSQVFESASDAKQFSNSSIQKLEVFQSKTKTSTLSNTSSKKLHFNEKKCLPITGSASFDSTRRSELCCVSHRASSFSTRSKQCCVSLASATEVYWPWTSQVPIETILTVIVSTMMPRSNTMNIQQTLDELIELVVDGSVTVHLLFNLPCMKNLFSNSKKFNLHSMHEVILNIINTRCLNKKN